MSEMFGFLFYIVVIIAVILNAKKKNQQKKKQQPGQPSMPVQPKAKIGEEDFKRLARMIMQQDEPVQQPIQTAPKQEIQPAPEPQPDVQAAAQDFYQGSSFGDEGIDPCHDDLYDTREPLDDPSAKPAEAGFHLSFTKDSVLNGVIMSEILSRRD